MTVLRLAVLCASIFLVGFGLVVGAAYLVVGVANLLAGRGRR